MHYVLMSRLSPAPLSISGISVSGANPSDFFYSLLGGTSVAPGQSSSISVSFTPSAGGTRTAQLQITDNAAGSPQSINLTGMITGPAVSLSPSALLFGPQAIGTVSTAQVVTLTNSGGGPMQDFSSRLLQLRVLRVGFLYDDLRTSRQ